MKTVFTLLLLIVAVHTAFACGGNISQNNWRWRNNDGSEATASRKADQKEPIIYNPNQAGALLKGKATNKYHWLK